MVHSLHFRISCTLCRSVATHPCPSTENARISCTLCRPFISAHSSIHSTVVTLFNAVAKQQKQLEADAEAAGAVDSAAKKAKADGAVKNNFLRLLKNESAKVGGSGAVPSPVADEKCQ